MRFMKDTDGDHRADIDEIAFEGLGRKNVQALVNNIRWSLDGWFVAASGGNGGTLRSRRMKDAAPVNVRGRDFRFRASGEIEPLTGGGQFGQSLDDFGRRFVCNNSDHARHVVLEHRYLVRNRSLAVPRAIASIAVEGPSSAVFRRSPPEPWRVVRTRLRVQGRVPGPIEHGGVAAGFFTSATGITVYRGDALPGCDGDLFIGDVASNLVHHKRLTVAGASFAARRVEDDREFLASPDIWFRPCNFANGPDGALYLCDMYREVIEHPWSLPDRIKKHLDLHSGDDRGRIWRVTAADAPAYQRPQLGKASTEELVVALARPGGWWRDTASRLLLERRDTAAAGLLLPLLEDDDPAVRAAVLWILQELGGLSDVALRARLRDPSASLREQALRIVERRPQPAVWAETLSKMVADPSSRLRFQLACTLGSIEGDVATVGLANLARRDGDETWNRFAILSSVTSPERALRMFEELVAEGRGEVATSMLRNLALLIGAWGRGHEADAVLAWLTAAGREHPGSWAVADGFASGRGRDLARLASGDARLRAALDGIFEMAVTAAADTSSSTARRLEAVMVLRSASFDSAGPVLLGLLDSRVDRALQSAAMRALATQRDPSIAPALLARWDEHGPALRSEILDFLFERVERLQIFLARVEDGRVPRSDLDRMRRERLAKHRDADLRARAEKIFGDEQVTDRSEVIAAYAAALKTPGDARSGKLVFEKNCAICHRLEGVGKVIGPDLRSMATRPPSALLEQILDPNREVNPAYLLYTLTTTDGRDLAGI
ncbi:MAG: c-type cytochrome, partial [Planctomycetota bacterium]|nr:c-type cytochrome [Planctomycetota bacterium]